MAITVTDGASTVDLAHPDGTNETLDRSFLTQWELVGPISFLGKWAHILQWLDSLGKH